MIFAIETNNLCKRFGGFFSRKKIFALNNLNLTVPENVIFGFLGPNGAGKTTTIKILLGLVLASSGSSKIFNIDTTAPETRDHVGFLPENPKFYPYLTARQFLTFCGELIHLDAMERSKRADELLEKVGLTNAADQKVDGFSRGMLQRLGIAQALVSDPDLIILDEPITGLDPMGRVSVKKILTDLRDEGKTIFFSSHILSDVEKMCDMIGILNHGRLIEQGRVEDIRSDIGADIYVRGLPKEAYEQGQEICDYIMLQKGDVIMSVSSAEQKEKVMEFLKAQNAAVVRTNRKQEDLETFFLRTIAADEQRRAAEAEAKEPAAAAAAS